jgi:arylsulfatase A-like enzyme
VTDPNPSRLAGVGQPGARYAGRPVLPITGNNLVQLLDGTLDRVYGPDEAVGYELTGHAALFQGDYKLVRNMPPRGDGQWRLYNIAIDPGEVTNLVETEAARYEQMLVRYEQFEKDNRVMAVPEGYSQTGQLLSNFLAERVRVGLVVFLLTLLLLLPFYVAYRLGKSPA